VNNKLKITHFKSKFEDTYLECIIFLKNVKNKKLVFDIIAVTRKLYIFNTHLNLSIHMKTPFTIETLLELNSNSLTIPIFENISEHIQLEYNVCKDHIFSFSEDFKESKIESIFIFLDNKIQNNLEIIIYKDRQYCQNEIIKDLLNSDEFIKTLKSNFIKIKNKEDV
jgi:hypothetical protein